MNPEQFEKQEGRLLNNAQSKQLSIELQEVFSGYFDSDFEGIVKSEYEASDGKLFETVELDTAKLQKAFGSADEIVREGSFGRYESRTVEGSTLISRLSCIIEDSAQAILQEVVYVVVNEHGAIQNFSEVTLNEVRYDENDELQVVSSLTRAMNTADAKKIRDYIREVVTT